MPQLKKNIAGYYDEFGRFRPIRSPQFVGSQRRKATPKDRKKYSRSKAGDNGIAAQEKATGVEFFDRLNQKEKAYKDHVEKQIRREFLGSNDEMGEGRSLVEFVRDSGGIRPTYKFGGKKNRGKRVSYDAGDLASLTYKESGKRGLVSEKGKYALDDMYKQATAAGYAVQGAWDLIDLMQKEIATGEKTYANYGYLDYRDNPNDSPAAFFFERLGLNWYKSNVPVKRYDAKGWKRITDKQYNALESEFNASPAGKRWAEHLVKVRAAYAAKQKGRRSNPAGKSDLHIQQLGSRSFGVFLKTYLLKKFTTRAAAESHLRSIRSRAKGNPAGSDADAYTLTIYDRNNRVKSVNVIDARTGKAIAKYKSLAGAKRFASQKGIRLEVNPASAVRLAKAAISVFDNDLDLDVDSKDLARLKRGQKAIAKNPSVASVILEQLGGNKFLAMTGAKNLGTNGRDLFFRLPARFANDGITYVKISLTPADLYDVEYGKIVKYQTKVLHVSKGIFADQLRADFTKVTGLDTSLGNMKGNPIDPLGMFANAAVGIASALQIKEYLNQPKRKAPAKRKTNGTTKAKSNPAGVRGGQRVADREFYRDLSAIEDGNVRKVRAAKLHGVNAGYTKKEIEWLVNRAKLAARYKAKLNPADYKTEMRKALKNPKAAKLSKVDAKRAAVAAGVDFSADFHSLRSSQVSTLVDLAKAAGYRRPKNANGSTARYFFSHLQRVRNPRDLAGNKAAAGSRKANPKTPAKANPKGKTALKWETQNSLDGVVFYTAKLDGTIVGGADKSIHGHWFVWGDAGVPFKNKSGFKSAAAAKAYVNRHYAVKSNPGDLAGKKAAAGSRKANPKTPAAVSRIIAKLMRHENQGVLWKHLTPAEKKTLAKYPQFFHEVGTGFLRNVYVKHARNPKSKIQNPKSKVPRSRTFEMFQGRPVTTAKQMPISKHAPARVAQLGDLIELRLVGGKVLKPNPKKFKLCAANGKLWIVGGKFAKPNPKAAANEVNPIAEISHVVYGTRKPHHGDNAYTHYIHKLGEESGKRPLLTVDREGYPVIRGGNYKIEARGIVD